MASAATTPPKTNAKPKTKTKSESHGAVRHWTACFVYPSATPETADIAIRRIRARDEERAREIALKSPPGEEFILTITPESDEQFLGQVRLKARSAAGKKG